MALQGQSYGAFHDIDQLTMFADYRVPVVLRDLGVLKYSSTLSKQVDPQYCSLICNVESSVPLIECAVLQRYSASIHARMPFAVHTLVAEEPPIVQIQEFQHT